MFFIGTVEELKGGKKEGDHTVVDVVVTAVQSMLYSKLAAKLFSCGSFLGGSFFGSSGSSLCFSLSGSEFSFLLGYGFSLSFVYGYLGVETSLEVLLFLACH
jgi:hypothetical protein